MIGFPESIVKLAKSVDGYIVGGAVRDSYLGIEPHDYDIATPLTTDEVGDVLSSLGLKVIPTGLHFGTVSTILPDVGEVEITTFRTEVYTKENGRKPTVTLTDDLIEDLSRRDFTINSMAYDPRTEEIIDPFRGREDLMHNILRFVGEPEDRIMEDPLRMLRAVRFASRYKLEIDRMNKVSIIENANLLQCISNERIWMEFEKSLSNPIEFLIALFDCGLENYVLSNDSYKMMDIKHDERHTHYGETILEHTRDVLADLNTTKKEVIVAAIFHDIGKIRMMEIIDDKIKFIRHQEESAIMTEETLTTMMKGLSKSFVKKVGWLVANHMEFCGKERSIKTLTRKAVDYRMSGITFDDLMDLMDLTEADKGIETGIERRIFGVVYATKLADGNDFLKYDPKDRKHLMRDDLLIRSRKNLGRLEQ